MTDAPPPAAQHRVRPGHYLRLQREAAGLSLDDVAARIATEPPLAEIERRAWLVSIEAGTVPIGDHVIAALGPVFPFDAGLLRRLAAHRPATTAEEITHG